MQPENRASIIFTLRTPNLQPTNKWVLFNLEVLLL